VENGRPQESAQSEWKSTTRFAEEAIDYQKWKFNILYSKYLKSRCSMNIQDNFSNPSQ